MKKVDTLKQRSKAAGACNEDSAESVGEQNKRIVTIADMQFDKDHEKQNGRTRKAKNIGLMNH